MCHMAHPQIYSTVHRAQHPPGGARATAQTQGRKNREAAAAFDPGLR